MVTWIVDHTFFHPLLVTKYFQKYGKKYKESDFGKHPVQKVEIVKVEGIQKDLAQAEAYTYLQEGPVYWVRVILQKKTFGWKSISWEKLGGTVSITQPSRSVLKTFTLRRSYFSKIPGWGKD